MQKAKSEEKSTKSVGKMKGADEQIYTMTIDGVEELASIQKFKRTTTAT